MNTLFQRTASPASMCPRVLSRTLIAGLLVALAYGSLQRVTVAQEARGQAQRGSGLLPLLLRADVCEELKMTDEQADAAKKLYAALPARLRDLGLGSKELSANEKRKRMAEFDTQLGGELESILLPPQMKRLVQIERQLRLQAPNISEEMFHDDVIKALRVTEEQRRRWNSIRQEIDREYDRERIAIKEKANARFLAELTSEQRAQWKEWFGVPFLAKEKPTSPRDIPAKKSAP